MTDTIETRDELGERLVELGLAPNSYLLDNNMTLSVPYGMELPAPWNLPSRLFRFPIEVSRPTATRPRTIGLVHPLLVDHPFVQHVTELLGQDIAATGAPNEYGYSKCRLGLWWHAVDLMTAGHWRELLETRRFTTNEDIARAVSHGVRYSRHDDKKAAGYIKTANARQVLRAIGTKEPGDRASTILGFSAPSLCRQDKGQEHWPINVSHSSGPFAEAWAMLHGIEDGWFKYDRSGFLQWTQTGRDRFAAGEADTFTQASGQEAFAF